MDLLIDLLKRDTISSIHVCRAILSLPGRPSQLSVEKVFLRSSVFQRIHDVLISISLPFWLRPEKSWNNGFSVQIRTSSLDAITTVNRLTTRRWSWQCGNSVCFGMLVLDAPESWNPSGSSVVEIVASSLRGKFPLLSGRLIAVWRRDLRYERHWSLVSWATACGSKIDFCIWLCAREKCASARVQAGVVPTELKSCQIHGQDSRSSVHHTRNLLK